MIFIVSKRVFLNVICPLSKKEDLLNANYYIADCAAPDRPGDYIGGDYMIDENGQVCEMSSPSSSPIAIIQTSGYNINYGSSELNPSIYATTFLHGNTDIESMRRDYYKHLMSYNVMTDIQNRIYLTERKGNGLLFLIYYDDENIIIYGDLIAQYLAKNFGEDVTFVDPKYRECVKGQYLYKGDILNARYIFTQLKDAQLLFGFTQATTNSFSPDESIANMNNFLLSYNMDELIRLYQLVWPDDPLPPNRYTISDMKEIIIGKMLDQTQPVMPRQSNLSIFNTFNPDDFYG
jgi:hypothetical protein